MSEFVMENRDECAREESPFVLGFIEAMFFTETGDTPAGEWFATDEEERTAGGQLPSDVGYADLHPDSLAAIRKDCEAWQEANAALLAEAYARDYDEVQAGIDYWFARNGYGVGFCDRKQLDAGGLGEKLSEACRYREVNPFFGDHVAYGDAPFVHVDL